MQHVQGDGLGLEALSVGMQLKAIYACRCGDPACDVDYHAATVVQISRSGRRASAPVRVRYTGYSSAHDAWVELNQLAAS